MPLVNHVTRGSMSQPARNFKTTPVLFLEQVMAGLFLTGTCPAMPELLSLRFFFWLSSPTATVPRLIRPS